MAIAVNASLLLLWPLAWWAPLARAGLMPWFGGSEISVAGAVAVLWEADVPLAILVALLGMALPYAKTVMLGLIQLGRLPARYLPWAEALARLAMADVFLIALYITVAKGVGLGYVDPAWGLWVFTGCVAAAYWAGQATVPPGGSGG
ncbi:MAG: paraquat-inducible protein A [Pseudomonadota bacterium]